MAEQVFIVDRIVTRPGRAREFVARLRGEYAPGAAGRGMRLARLLVSPPMWHEGANTVTAVWELDGVAAWWEAARAGRGDPALRDWWDGIAALVEERSRSMAAEDGAVDVLCGAPALGGEGSADA